MGVPRLPAADRPLARVRCGVWAYFFLDGAVMATWTARVPAVKGRLHLSDGALSLGLLAVAADTRARTADEPLKA